MKTERYFYSVETNELVLIPETEITKKDFMNKLSYLRNLESADDNDENYHSNHITEREGETMYNKMYRFSVNSTDVYLIKQTCKEGYRFLTRKEREEK